MSRGFGSNSKFDATSNAYRNSPLWDKPGEKPELPQTDDLWSHKRTGQTAKILYVTNTQADSQNSREFPVTVVYEHPNRVKWSLPLDKFRQRYEEGAKVE
jgi:hypothetical protein